MAQILVLSNLPGQSPIPALQLLTHQVSHHPLEVASALRQSTVELVCIDATLDLVAAHRVCTSLANSGFGVPVLLIMNEGGLAAITESWGATDLILASAGPAEIETRIRLALEPHRGAGQYTSKSIRAASLVIDEASYSAKIADRTLDLTYKEFELLRFLASHPSHVFTREQLLSEVWGYDYFGGTRTVDVHVRRLRAKLGDHEQLIGTVRNVGYQFIVAEEHDEALQPVDQ